MTKKKQGTGSGLGGGDLEGCTRPKKSGNPRAHVTALLKVGNMEQDSPLGP